MYCIPFVFCLLVGWQSAALFEVEGRPATPEHVFPRVLEERSSEGHLTLLVKDDIVLDLEKTSAFADNFEFVQLGGTTNLIEERSSSSFRGDVYKDENHHSAVLISREDGLRMKGIIGGSLRIDHLEKAVPNKHGSVLHFLNKIEHNTFDGIERQLGGAEGRSDEELRNIISARNTGSNKTITVNKTTVETRVVISTQYAAAFKTSDYSHVDNLLDYLRVFFAFANMVCLKFNKNVLDLQVNVVGVVMLQQVTETFMHKFDGADALKPETLNGFNKFITVRKNVFVHEDIVVYFTPYRIGQILPDGKLSTGGAGLAGVGGACTDHRGCLVTDLPKEFSGVYNFVHEMLHLLGSAHDGEKAPEYLKTSPGGTLCSGPGDFLMSPVHTGNKKLTISSCTERQVLAYLTNQQGHCLLSRVTRQRHVVTMEKTYVDRQRFCRRMVTEVSNPEFIEKFDEENDIKNCILMCRWEQEKQFYIRLRRAPNYTPCKMVGNKVEMICLRNNCTNVPKLLHSFMNVRQQTL